MSTKAPVLLEAPGLARLLQRAIDSLDHHRHARPDTEDDEDHIQFLTTMSPRVQAALHAAAFCALEAGLHGQSEMLSTVEDSFDAAAEWSGGDAARNAIARGVGLLVRSEAVPSPTTHALAASPRPLIRAAVASHLGPSAPEAIAILMTLAKDADREVREAARETLGPELAPQWWSGLFTADPVARLGNHEAASAAPLLGRLKLLAELPWDKAFNRERRELPGIVRGLPDVLATELAESVLKRPQFDYWSDKKVLAELLRRPGGVDALRRITQHRIDHNGGHGSDMRLLVKMAARFLPAQAREAVALELARFACSAPWQERHAHDACDVRPWAEMAAVLWPRRANPAPLLELLLAMDPPDEQPELGTDWVIAGLDEALEKTAADIRPLLPRIVEAHLAGSPGAWIRLRRIIDAWLRRAPVRMVREAALKGIHSPHDHVMHWSVVQLLGRAHKPREDGTLLQTVERFWEMPRTRRVLGGYGLRNKAVVPLRRALRQGVLGFEEACAAIDAIDELWGGCAGEIAWGMTDQTRDARRAAARREYRAFLGPRALHGPITAEEWAHYRAARATRAASTAREGRDVLSHFPETDGPWHPADFAVIQQAMNAPDPDRVGVALALSTNPRVEHEPLWDQLIRDTPDPHRRRWLRKARKRVHEALGIPPPTRPPAQDSHDEDDGWGDTEESA